MHRSLYITLWALQQLSTVSFLFHLTIFACVSHMTGRKILYALGRRACFQPEKILDDPQLGLRVYRWISELNSPARNFGQRFSFILLIAWYSPLLPWSPSLVRLTEQGFWCTPLENTCFRASNFVSPDSMHFFILTIWSFDRFLRNLVFEPLLDCSVPILLMIPFLSPSLCVGSSYFGVLRMEEEHDWAFVAQSFERNLQLLRYRRSLLSLQIGCLNFPFFGRIHDGFKTGYSNFMNGNQIINKSKTLWIIKLCK